MVDLAQVVHYERAFPLALKTFPKGEMPKEIGVTIMVRHVDCGAAAEISQAAASASVTGRPKQVGEGELYAACVAGWEGDVQIDGEALPYTPENARRLLCDPRCKWILAQVRAAALDIGNFTDA